MSDLHSVLKTKASTLADGILVMLSTPSLKPTDFLVNYSKYTAVSCSKSSRKEEPFMDE